MTDLRIGFRNPETVLWQGDPRWSKIVYGNGNATIGNWGCPAACIAQACRFFGDDSATPDRIVVNARSTAWSEGSSLAFLPQLARANRISCPLVSYYTHEGLNAALIGKKVSIESARKIQSRSVSEFSEMVVQEISKGSLFWMHVSHSGDWIGDHWILAFAVNANSILCTDSATASVVDVSRKTLQAETKWRNKLKTYIAVRGYPLRKMI